jgi:ABC-type transport system substrate-binding protein
MSRMILRSSVLGLATAGLLLAACSKKDDASSTTAAASAAAPDTAAPAATTAAPTAAPVPTHVPPVTTTVVTNQSIDSCCNALANAGKSGKDAAAKQKAATAAGVCTGIAPKVKNGTVLRASALTQIKSGLVGTTVPPECN